MAGGADGSGPVEIHVVSDATGETATRVVMAVERQFPDLPFEVVRHPRITCAEDLQLAATRARGRRAVVVYTLVDAGYRQAMRTLCRRYRLHYCDLLGHPIDAIARISGLAPKGEPGALQVLDQTYFKRIEAIEFAVQADDGASVRRLTEADIVLVGVSRTSKTPLSIYLGYLGYKTANVPIVNGIEPPAQLLELEPARIVGVTLKPELLAEIRERRVRQMRGSTRSYSDLADIYEELDWAEEIHRRLGCPVIEVSTLAVEETAYRIIRLVELRLEESRKRDAATRSKE
jgi:[pyruvate, water dikinase]-phosphate phosphotransferase / [pyruvate, water dikinase] kinase